MKQTQPPFLRYVYPFPGLVVIVVQNLITAEVISIVTEEYELFEDRENGIPS